MGRRVKGYWEKGGTGACIVAEECVGTCDRICGDNCPGLQIGWSSHSSMYCELKKVADHASYAPFLSHPSIHPTFFVSRSVSQEANPGPWLHLANRRHWCELVRGREGGERRWLRPPPCFLECASLGVAAPHALLQLLLHGSFPLAQLSLVLGNHTPCLMPQPQASC